MPLIIVKRRFYDAFCEGTGRLARVDAPSYRVCTLTYTRPTKSP
jgi:hypothetical protein